MIETIFVEGGSLLWLRRASAAGHSQRRDQKAICIESWQRLPGDQESGRDKLQPILGKEIVEI